MADYSTRVVAVDDRGTKHTIDAPYPCQVGSRIIVRRPPEYTKRSSFEARPPVWGTVVALLGEKR